ncbi:MAG: 30S ribosomal protein S30e [Candidatus Lokiarchaeota archaeon]|jgi:small subunit ribosomal protein S30e|nr:30S ribosomal protein S30e [Candidatus Lokiarchaeota archaeon]
MPGSHGSLTKAGKVRQQTPKIPRSGVNSRKKKPPRIRFRELYKARIINERFGGQQDSLGAKRSRYKR